jgi:hypothetical protein
MSEFAFEQNEMLRPLGEAYDGLREHASEMLGRISTRMGFGEAAIAYSTEGDEDDNNTIAEMAEEDEEKKDDDNGNDSSGEQSGHDSSKCTATVCSACGRGGGGRYFSAVPRKPK